MVVLDAYALIAFLLREPRAGHEARELIERGDAAISSVNLVEVVDVCSRQRGVTVEKVRAPLEPLIVHGRLIVLAPDAAVAWRAGTIRARHYRRRTSELSLADCFLLASAIPGKDAIATADPPVAEVARALSIELHALPDSTGRRP